MNLSENGTFRVGEWRIEPALDEISRNGKTIKLEPRAMQVLVCLARRPGEVVRVDDLLDGVWKDVVVTQDSVYQAVASLRRALGDDPKDPSYIANVLRRGYRLVAPVNPSALPLAVDQSMDGSTDSCTPSPVGNRQRACEGCQVARDRTCDRADSCSGPLCELQVSAPPGA